VTFSKASLAGSGLLCPEVVLWDAKYTIQLPHEVFVGATSPSPPAENTTLCTTDLSEICPTGNIYTGHVEALAVKPELLSNLANVSCEHSVILGNALGLGSAPDEKGQLTHIELIDFTGNCKTDLGVSCTVTTISLGLADLSMTEANEGLLVSLGNEVKVVCKGVINCTFGGEPHGEVIGASLPLGTSSLASVTFSKASLAGSGLLCPEVVLWDAKYTIQLPHEVFVAT
jgi:hypothetical protein